MNIDKRKVLFLLHPILFGLYSLFLLYNNNADYVTPNEFMLVSLGLSTIILAVQTIFYFVFRQSYLAAIVTSLLTIIALNGSALALEFLSSTNLMSSAKDIIPRWLIHQAIVVAIILCIALMWYLKRKNYNFSKFNNALTFFSFALVLMNVPNAISNMMRDSGSNSESSVKIDLTKKNEVVNAPNIYYIILDGYASNSVLQNYYGFTNPFPNRLKELGFWCNPQSVSNYPRTLFSLTSTLNLNYCSELLPNEKGATPSLGKFKALLSDNIALKLLKKYNYKTIFMHSGHYIESSLKADTVKYPENLLHKLFTVSPLCYAIAERATSPLFVQRHLCYRHTLNQIKWLKETTSNSSPFFCFTHIMPPHFPPLFKEDGTLQDLTIDVKTGYLENIKFLNRQIFETVKHIFNNSKTKPIIIIQGDHGWSHMPEWGDYREKPNLIPAQYGILNAVYIPENLKRQYTENDFNMSVNTFRLIFNTCFNEDFKMLEPRFFIDKPLYGRSLLEITDEFNRLKKAQISK